MMPTTNAIWPSSTPRLKKRRAAGDFGLGQACFAEDRSKAKAVEQAKRRGDRDGVPVGEALLVAPDDLHCEEDDAQGDGGFDGGDGHLHEVKRAQRERDRVGDREAGDRDQNAAARSGDEK